jgi:predicted N-formylglutamate amidohydrolase
MADTDDHLLDSDEPAPAGIINSDGASPFLLLGDHAGTAIPRRLGTLGVSPGDRARHIAVDIGIRAVGERLAARIDATFIHQPYSRLVIDCNRDPATEDAMPAVSDGLIIPGNRAAGEGDRRRRIAAIHRPYHDRIAAEIAARTAAGRPTILIALHSFTPVMAGIARPWHVGVLHWTGETGFARGLLATLGGEAGLIVGDNEPYRMDAIDYTVPRHAIAAGLPYAEIEVRQDLIAEADGQEAWAVRLGEAFAGAWLRAA